MIYRINKKKLKPRIIEYYGSVTKFNQAIGISKMRWSQVTRTNYKRDDAPTIERICAVLDVKKDQFLDKLEIGD